MNETKRQSAHIVLGITSIILLKLWHYYAVALLILTAVSFLVLASINKKRKIIFVDFLVNTFERDKDIKRMPGRGFFFFLLGISLTYTLFPKDVAFASIIILSVGDAFATLIGKKNGKTKISEKSLEGSFFGFILSFFSALFFVSYTEALFASLIASFIELLSHDFDDNLLIPLSAGLAITLLRLI